MKVTLLMCITADGRIGKSSTHFADWTSKEDKQLFVSVTKRARVMVMGAKTYATIGRPLPDRLIIVMVLDAAGFVNIPDQVEYVSASPSDILVSLEARGFTECILAGGATINAVFLAARLIDEVILTVEPVIFGSGLPLFADPSSDSVLQDMKLQLRTVERINDNAVTLQYTVIKDV